MFKKLSYCFFFMVMGFLFATPVFAASITFTFANGQITGTTPMYYEFDVMAQADSSGTKLGDCQVYINYNTVGFGPSIVTNSKITVTKGTLLDGVLVPDTELYLYLIENTIDNTSSRVGITIGYQYEGTPTSANDLPTTPTQLIHIKIEIVDTSQTAGLSFQQSLMDGQQYESNNSDKYSTVITSDTDDTSLPVQLSSFTALSSDKGVLVFWRAETEVNNLGFAIYRSEEKNGKYIKIGFVHGAGSSAMPNEYEFADKEVEAGKTYFYYLEDIDITGEKSKSEIIKIVVPAAQPVLPIPKEFRLLQNFPNPFNPDTWLPYQLAQDADVVIHIYNINGQILRVLQLGKQNAGVYLTKGRAAYWNGRDSFGEKVAGGVYFYTLRAGDFKATRKMVIMK